MKKYRLSETLLTERFVNLSNRDELSQYIDEIWDIMQESYKYLEGGFATASSKEELLDKVSFAKLVKKNNKIVAACLYKDKNGRKSIAAGTDGSSEGKKWIMKLFQEDIKFGRSWGEVSGKAEHVKLKMGAVPIPNTMAAELTGKEILSLDPDGFHYTRIIGGQEVRKILVGNPQ